VFRSEGVVADKVRCDSSTNNKSNVSSISAVTNNNGMTNNNKKCDK
jgi:hypothetical protein